MLIAKGMTKKEERIRTNPEEKSIQLAKSLNMPKNDFIKRIIPNINKIIEGIFIPAPNNKVRPERRSIAPRILTSMFFKSCFYLKTLAKPE